ncbi:MAG: DUF3089 domain-containing protein [Alphaproteobacteria bacterium]|nr:DUF3089 domain-containing protein [Alphaproteobacteria bacterium]
MRRLLIIGGLVLVLLAVLTVLNRVTLQAMWLVWVSRPGTPVAETTLPPAPDYADPRAWAALPFRVDAADVAPQGLAPLPDDAAPADVFYIHPTTYFGNANWNQPLDHAATNAMTDLGPVRHQASVFSGCCRVYAPRYRQATFYAFYEQGAAEIEAIERAYPDVRAAFEHYLSRWNQGRPFLIAAHSQGARYALWLLEDYVQGTELEERFVAAYVVGYAVPDDYFERQLPRFSACERPDQLRCVAGWSTYGRGGETRYIRTRIRHRFGDAYESNEGKSLSCVNPLTWDSRVPAAGAGANLGGWIYPASAAAPPASVPDLVGAACEDGALILDRTPPSSFRRVLLPGRNYHNYDYQLFYLNIRENAALRVRAHAEERARVPAR